MSSDSTARNLTDRVDALAAALRDAGVSPEQSAGLLAAAARAAMNAVVLDAVLDDRSATTVRRDESPAPVFHLAA